jgi:diacylglycerol kinase family enzyme
MLPLGSFNDMSRAINSHKLKKYTKKDKNFKPKNIHKTVGKIVYKML